MFLTDLKDKVVLITGASTGIGAATAIAFASCGSRVALHYNQNKAKALIVAKEIENAGGEVFLVQGDLFLKDSPKKIVSQVILKFGCLDILVNNAGSLVARKLVAEYDDEYLDQIISLNIKQVANFVKYSVIEMRKNKRVGVIINVGSSAARHGGAIGSAIYSATKGFISSATKAWAKELAQDLIRVNAISPGVIDTPFHAKFTSVEAIQNSIKLIPLKRIGTSNECASTIIYLASEKMSSFVTGQIIEVNGGQVMP
jgi:3-oxoacyl-[acyl-carrier protein] reductase